jgi:hypothetical protein
LPRGANENNHQQSLGLTSVASNWPIADRPQPLILIYGRLVWGSLLRSLSALFQQTALAVASAPTPELMNSGEWPRRTLAA